jgi:hypothetical protein
MLQQTVTQIDYILEAILFVADDNGGWKLLPQYIFNQVDIIRPD